MSKDGLNELAGVGGRLPDADALVHPGGDEALAVRVPGEGVHPVGGVAEGVEPPAVGRVPHLDRPVGRRRGEQLAVR
jgi:hypothetical protein